MAQISGKILVIFDFDGTIYKGDSFMDFALMVCGRWKWLCALALSVPYILAWKLGFITNGKAKQHLFGKLYNGMAYNQFKRFGEIFAEQIDRNCDADVVGRLDVAEGDVVIVTASISDWVLPWAQRHGVWEVIATEVEVRETCLTGKFSTPNCFGKEKVRRIMEKIPDAADFYKVVYTDSTSADAPMIAMADECVIVGDISK